MAAQWYLVASGLATGLHLQILSVHGLTHDARLQRDRRLDRLRYTHHHFRSATGEVPPAHQRRWRSSSQQLSTGHAFDGTHRSCPVERDCFRPISDPPSPVRHNRAYRSLRERLRDWEKIKLFFSQFVNQVAWAPSLVHTTFLHSDIIVKVLSWLSIVLLVFGRVGSSVAHNLSTGSGFPLDFFIVPTRSPSFPQPGLFPLFCFLHNSRPSQMMQNKVYTYI